ncbi:PIN domain-containing protein [Verrucomicrobiaceae bacterium R5-34]|nr:PIN domain-containing protein [Verrucomicrobiaceae bacterium R5-34]
MIYADTSILASLVMRDKNSAMALDLFQSATKPFAYNWLHKLEVGNALRLSLSEKRLTESDVSVSESTVEELVSSRRLEVIEPDWGRVFERGRGLSLAHTKECKARSLDILHVACAMDLQIREFWSFDDRQRKLAEFAGLRTNSAH